MDRLDFDEASDGTGANIFLYSRSCEDARAKKLLVQQSTATKQKLPFLVSEVGSKPKSFTSPVPQSDSIFSNITALSHPFLVMQRLKSFLPELKKANDELLIKNAEDINIENVKEGSKCIEMVQMTYENRASHF